MKKRLTSRNRLSSAKRAALGVAGDDSCEPASGQTSFFAQYVSILGGGHCGQNERRWKKGYQDGHTDTVGLQRLQTERRRPS